MLDCVQHFLVRGKHLPSSRTRCIFSTAHFCLLQPSPVLDSSATTGRFFVALDVSLCCAHDCFIGADLGFVCLSNSSADEGLLLPSFHLPFGPSASDRAMQTRSQLPIDLGYIESGISISLQPTDSFYRVGRAKRWSGGQVRLICKMTALYFTHQPTNRLTSL